MDMYGQQAPEPIWQLEPIRQPRRYGAEVLVAVVVAAVVAVLGFVLNAVWRAAAPTLPLRKVADGAVYTSADPEELIAGDGWFAIIGLIFGIVVAVVVWIVAKQWRGPLQMLGLTFGAVVAGFLALNVASGDVQQDFRAQLREAPVDAVVERPADVRVATKLWCVEDETDCTRVGGVLLFPALGAVLGYGILAAWSSRPDLRPTEPQQSTYSDIWSSNPH